MTKYQKVVVWILLLFSLLHTIRDIMQILHVNHPLATLLKTNPPYCQPYCDYIAFPPEFYLIFTSLIILKRNAFGILGGSSIVVFIVWGSLFLINYFI